MEVAALKPDLLVSFAYGRIFGPRFLALFPQGGINIHPSLLPKYRGASPIPAVILAREKKTGVCVQRLAEQMDSGDILMEEVFPLSGGETTLSLSEAVSQKAAVLLRALLEDFDSRLAGARPQRGEAVYCREITKEQGLIDWAESAVQIDARIRAFTPWPLSFTRLGEDTLIILEAEAVAKAYAEAVGVSAGKDISGARPGTVLGTDSRRGILIQTGDGVLAVSRLQKQAKKPLDWKAFCNGERGFIGARLSN
jgi:methionyl-tRNA formyltransferase